MLSLGWGRGDLGTFVIGEVPVLTFEQEVPESYVRDV